MEKYDNGLSDEQMVQMLDRVERERELKLSEEDLNAKAARRKQLEDEMAVYVGNLRRLADEHKGKRGSYNKKDKALKSKSDAAILLLRQGILPAEFKQAAKPSKAEALATARNTPSVPARLAHPQRPPAGRQKSGTEPSAVQDSSKISDSDDEEEEANAAYEPCASDQYYAITSSQVRFIRDELEKLRRGKLSSALEITRRPPNPLKGEHVADPSTYCLLPTSFWAPHIFFNEQGIPSQPPCPNCGWSAVEKKQVQSDGWIKPGKARRVFGISTDEYLMGTRHRCNQCKIDKAALMKEAEASTGEEKQTKIATARRHQCHFLSYNPAVTKLYFERYPWVAAQMPATICSKRTAMTHDLARVLHRSCATGGNPTDLAKMLEECKAQQFDMTRLVYYSYQLFNKKDRFSGGGQVQLTMEKAFSRSEGTGSACSNMSKQVSQSNTQVEPDKLTEAIYGLASPGHGLIRSYFVDKSSSKAEYQFLWRQQRVGGDIVQGDHTMKVSKGCHVLSTKLLNNRFTLWSSHSNCPLVSVNLETTSLDDPGLVLACKALMQVYSDGRAAISLAYLDNPHRDEKGLIRRVPSLTRQKGTASEVPQQRDCNRSETEVHQLAESSAQSDVAQSNNDTFLEHEEGVGKITEDTVLLDVDETDNSKILPSEFEADLIDAEDGLEDLDDTVELDLAKETPESLETPLLGKSALSHTMLEAAQNFLRAFAASGATGPANLPSALSVEDRAALHCLAENLGLTHVSTGSYHERHLVIGRCSTHNVDDKTGQPEIREEQGRHSGGSGCDSSAAGGTSSSDDKGYDDEWETRRVKYDPRHWMANFFLMAHSKESGLFKYFCTATSEALFEILPGERERVILHLKKRGMTDEQIKLVPRKYWRQHCRYRIPAPRELVPRLQAVYDFFKDLIDPATQRPFFNSKHAQRFAIEIAYVKKGYLSDPPSRPLYMIIATLTTGLVIYRCLRTSSALEGYHLHLRQILVAGAKGSSPQWQEAVMNEFDFRWCVRALKRAGLLPQWVRHFDLELYDYLYDLSEKLYGDGKTLLPEHQRTRKEPVVLRHGMHFALQHQASQAAGHPTHLVSGESMKHHRTSETASRWVSSRLGVTSTLRAHKTAADIQNLLNQPNSNDIMRDPLKLSAQALSIGVLMPPSNAAKFYQRVILDSGAWGVLLSKDYAALQARLRGGQASNQKTLVDADTETLKADSTATLCAPPVPLTGGLQLPPPSFTGYLSSSAQGLLSMQPAAREGEQPSHKCATSSTQSATADLSDKIEIDIDAQRRERARIRKQQQRQRERAVVADSTHSNHEVVLKRKRHQREYYRDFKRSQRTGTEDKI